LIMNLINAKIFTYMQNERKIGRFTKKKE